MAATELEQRVVRTADAILAEQQYVSALDVLVGLGWLAPIHVDRWRQGRADCLERLVQANLAKISKAMAHLRRWAGRKGLLGRETAYVSRARDRRPLRFSVSGRDSIERAYRTHWVSPKLSAVKRDRLVERESRSPDLVVVPPVTGGDRAVIKPRPVRPAVAVGSCTTSRSTKPPAPSRYPPGRFRGAASHRVHAYTPRSNPRRWCSSAELSTATSARDCWSTDALRAAGGCATGGISDPDTAASG